MLYLLLWAIYGAVVGYISELLYRNGPKSWAATIGIGVAGSWVGGVINWLLYRSDAVSPTGFLMGILGSVVCLWMWDKFRLNRIINMRK